MSKFRRLLEGDIVDASTGEVKSAGKLQVNMKELLAAGFTDILNEKSSLYHEMTKKGVKIHIDIELPKEGFSGQIKELVNSYNGDVS